MTKIQMLTAIIMLKDGFGSEDIAVKLAETTTENSAYWLPKVRGMISNLRAMGHLDRVVIPA